MFGTYRGGIKPNSDRLRLPSPVFSFPDKNFPSNPEAQRNEFNHSPNCSDNLLNSGFSQNNNPWINGSGPPRQANRKERFPKPPRERYNKPRNYNNVNKFGGRGGSSHYCDSCDRGFSSLEEYQYHCSNEHITCGLDGCTLSAHPKVVEKHQKIQHLSGLYLRLKANSSKNPEDVAKWIAERKRNYPTRENIERRKEEDEEKLQRGESLVEERGRFGRFGHGGRGQKRGMRGRGGRGRGRGCGRRRDGNQSQSNEGHASRDRRGRGRGGHRKNRPRNSQQKDGKLQQSSYPCQETDTAEYDEEREIPMFCGTAALLGISLEDHESSDEEVESDRGAFSDSEWLLDEGASLTEGAKKNETCESVAGNPPSSEKAIVLNNSLGLLIGNYGSDDCISDEDDSKADNKPPANKRVCIRDESDRQQKTQVIATLSSIEEKKTDGNSIVSEAMQCETVKMDEDSDGSAPEVESIKKEERKEEVAVGEGKERGEGVQRGDDGKRSRGRKGRKRGRMREERDERLDEKREKTGEKKGGDKAVWEKKPLVQRQRYPTLLEELLKTEIRHERNVILQCVRYVVENNFFDKVKMVSSKEVGAKETAVVNGDTENNPSELQAANDPQSVDDCEKEYTILTRSPAEKHDKNSDSPSEEEDCSVEEQDSCIVTDQHCEEKSSDDGMKSKSQKELEPKEKTEITCEIENNTLMSQVANCPQSVGNCSNEDVVIPSESLAENHDKNSDSSSKNNNCIIEKQNSFIATEEKVLVNAEKHSSDGMKLMLSKEGESQENTALGCENENNSLVSQMVNEPQSVGNCFKEEVVISSEPSAEKHHENSDSSTEKDKKIAEEHRACITAEDNVKQSEFSSPKESEDDENAKSNTIPIKDDSDAVKAETIADIQVQESEETKDTNLEGDVQSFENNKNPLPSLCSDLTSEMEKCD